MAANKMSNINISPDVLSTLLLLQQGNLYKLQQQILHNISRGTRPEAFCKKAPLKTHAEFTGKQLCWSLFLIISVAEYSKTAIARGRNIV